LQNAANSDLRFDNRCCYFHCFIIWLHPVSLSATICQRVACCFNWLRCKRQQTAVCLRTLYSLQASIYAFAKPAALQKEDRRTPQGFTTNHYTRPPTAVLFVKRCFPHKCFCLWKAFSRIVGGR